MERKLFVPTYIQNLMEASSNGLDGIGDALATLVNQPTIIVDPLYRTLSSSQIKGEAVLQYFDGDREDLHIEQPDLLTCKLTIDEKLYSGILSMIVYDGRTRGYVIVIYDEISQDIVNELGEILPFAASLCSLDFKKMLELKQERHKFKEAFILDTIYGNIKKKEEMISYGEIWGWNFTKPYLAIVFSLKNFDYYSEDQGLLDLLFYTVDKTLVERGVNPIAMKRRDEVIVIFSEEDQTLARLSTTEFIEVIHSFITQSPLQSRMAVGIGRCRENPTDIFRSYQEAKVALELGILLSIQAPSFQDLGLERILYKHDLQDLKEYYEHTLGPLENYNSEQGNELMATLEAFVANGFDLTKTADAMFIHRNTMRYRVKRIEEILKMKLDDIQVRLNITAALKIKQLRKI